MLNGHMIVNNYIDFQHITLDRIEYFDQTSFFSKHITTQSTVMFIFLLGFELDFNICFLIIPKHSPTFPNISHHSTLFRIIPYHSPLIHTIPHNFTQFHNIPQHSLPFHTTCVFIRHHWVFFRLLGVSLNSIYT